jgi:hypothetical protein
MHYDNNGRPKLYTGERDPLISQAFRLTLWHIRAARRLGGGNASEGVRRAIERAVQEGEDWVKRPERNDTK